MERITLDYMFRNGEKDMKEVQLALGDKDDEGLHDYEICDMFMDFMRSAGFSEENVLRYFRE